MKGDAAQSLSSVIRANTERRSLEELAAAGKKSFRVISGSRVMELIHAIVDDAIQREAMEMVQADRDRIVSQSKQQLDRVLAIQAKQDDVIRREKLRTREMEEELEIAREEVERLTGRLERERSIRDGREAKLLVEREEKVAGLMEEKQQAEARIQAAVETTHLLERMLKEEKNRRAQREQEAAEGHRAELETARAEFDRREQELLSKHERELAEAKAEIKRLRRQVARLKEDRGNLIARFEGERGEFAANQEEALAEAQALVERAETELIRRRNEIEALRSASTERSEKLVEEHRRQLEDLRLEHQAMMTRLESERGELAGRQEQALADARLRIEELELDRAELRGALARAEAEKEQAEKDLAQAEARLVAATTTIDGQQEEVERLRTRLDEASEEVERYRHEIEERDRRLTADRERAAEMSVASLRDEVSELNQLVRTLGQNPAGIDEKALDRLARQFGSQRSDMESRFDSQMEKTLSEVTRVLKVATARPLDEAVEATDVLVDRVFDDSGLMKSNYSALEVEERTSKSGIDDHLNRLRAARTASSPRQSERE